MSTALVVCFTAYCAAGILVATGCLCSTSDSTPAWIEVCWLGVMVFGSGNIIFAFLALPVPSAIVFSHAVCVAWGLASFRIRRRFDGASAATLVELVSVIAAPVVIAVGMFLTIADSSVWLYRRLKVVGRHQYDKAPAA